MFGSRRLALLLALPSLLAAACDNVTCKTVQSPVASACMPDSIEVDREVRIELRELCGRNCLRQPICTATFSSGVIVLDITAQQCNDVLINLCAAEGCQQRVYGCKLPPLPQGDYTLRAPGLPDQPVRVRHGGADACALANADGGV